MRHLTREVSLDFVFAREDVRIGLDCALSCEARWLDTVDFVLRERVAGF